MIFLLIAAYTLQTADALFSYNTCVNEEGISSKATVSSFTANQFYNICPESLSSTAPLSQPICGDGSAFSFYFSKPTQKKENRDKILIEFLGGGACWNTDTCGQQSDSLAISETWNAFVGYSCSETQALMSSYGESMSFLCARQVGEVDFTEYNTIIVPYCTQDVHMGDRFMAYDGGEVYHHGAHNMNSVLQWIYVNFPNPSHIALTGCSAGATSLPIVYDLIGKHYNSSITGGRSTSISVIMDSAVYLTPQYFLSNSIENWNPRTVMNLVNFNYEKWQNDETFLTKLWDHVLQRGWEKDKWGFLSHTYDSTSITYWKDMGGMYNGNYDGESSIWWNNLTTSIDIIKINHKNVDTFFIDGEGHCTLGLYYGLQVEGFEDWAENIFKMSVLPSDAPSATSEDTASPSKSPTRSPDLFSARSKTSSSGNTASPSTSPTKSPDLFSAGSKNTTLELSSAILILFATSGCIMAWF